MCSEISAAFREKVATKACCTRPRAAPWPRCSEPFNAGSASPSTIQHRHHLEQGVFANVVKQPSLPNNLLLTTVAANRSALPAATALSPSGDPSHRRWCPPLCKCGVTNHASPSLIPIDNTITYHPREGPWRRPRAMLGHRSLNLHDHDPPTFSDGWTSKIESHGQWDFQHVMLLRS